tara:strand:- start:174 stop:359 length:186 start_codon:yes stop_codon:yes gene_type:complete
MSSDIIDKLVHLVANKIIKEVIFEFEESEESEEEHEYTFIENPYRYDNNCFCFQCKHKNKI